MRTRKTAAWCLAATIMLAGCTSGRVEVPYEYVAPSRAVESVEEDTLSDRELAQMALQLTWDNMSQSDVDNICDVWTEYPTMRGYLVDEFMDGAGDFGVALGRDAVSAFFSGECGR